LVWNATNLSLCKQRNKGITIQKLKMQKASEWERN
jgi:hypothetical protein